MDSITFLDKDQVKGTHKLSIIEEYGVKCKVTDFAAFLGAAFDSTTRNGFWWTKTFSQQNKVYTINSDGQGLYEDATDRSVGARLVLPYSKIESLCSNKVSLPSGLMEVELGSYPQTIVDDASALENCYLNGNSFLYTLAKTNRNYVTDSCKNNGLGQTFAPRVFEEYEYENKKYIRIVGDDISCGKKLSNGEIVVKNRAYWIAVEPIKWLVSEHEDIAITKEIIFAGVEFNHNVAKSYSYGAFNYYGSGHDNYSFEQSNIKKFMKRNILDEFKPEALKSFTHFASPSGVQSANVSSNSPNQRKVRKSSRNPVTINLNVSTDPNMCIGEKRTRMEMLNPDTSDPAIRKRMTDTEIIHSWIEAGQSVLLRGPSGIGKTERIKELYPDLIYIKLTNNMFPEKVVGSINIQTGQSIPPDFAKQALLACATEEEKRLINENVQNLFELADQIYERSKNSDKKIVIMLDELLNVKPAVQALVYTLVLNRLVEIGKGLKLPANTVIVATGNQKKYSSVAEDLVEPLEKRFDHIFDMRPKVSEWITEYAIPHKIHPSVVGYILSKYEEANKSENISDIGYFYEEPEEGEKNLDKNGCKGRTNDPRGWVSISNTLYALEEDLRDGKFIGKNVEDLFRTSIKSKLREEWANEFFNFYNIPTISVEAVVTNSYSQSYLPVNINEKYACVTALLLADENQVEQCREFIRKYCSPEFLILYDLTWAGNDIYRMQKISELKATKQDTNGRAGRR